jgi:hypothetical protein
LLANRRSAGRLKATIIAIAPRRSTADETAPARLANKLPDTSAPAINRTVHATEESIQAAPNAHMAAGGSLPNFTKRRKVNAVPAPGPIKGSVKEIAFPMVAVAAIHGIEM